MTAQVTHSFEYDGEAWSLLLVSQNFKGRIVPPEFTMETRGNSTAGGPGYHVTCGLSENQLIVRHFRVTGDVMLDEEDENGNQRFLRAEGSRADWEGDHRWQVFPKLPPINGQLPEVRIFKARGFTFSKKADYDVTKPETYLEPYKDERVEYSTYRNLDLPVNFSGGMLLGTGGSHAGWSLPTYYKRVMELTFIDGVMTDATDQSELVQSIIAGAEHANVAISNALERSHDDLPHFKHIYYMFPVI